MPDVSLLQREYYGEQEQESRLPGVVFTAALSALLIVIAAYVGLFLYNRVLVSRADAIAKHTKDLKVEDMAETIKDLEALGVQTKNLKMLREAHTYSTKMFAYMESATHPASRFSDTIIDAVEKTIQAKGFISSPVLLARQVEIYEKDKKEGRILDFSLQNIGYGERQAVAFNLVLTLGKP
ncbi:hypothetical protein HY250_03030 [Candidatus Azambacteria bacterium]|nr:hypothetical protein [Candidatus Azambacteria bacterium]MBI3685353.1 hypothetical protein [Candidatus Azambacteria bacterium]